jgi:hypothetical protein
VLEWDVQQLHMRLRLVGRGFLGRRGTIHVGRGAVAADIAQARSSRGST